MGGMLATRYALLYPRQVERLVLVNPIGLEDWKALGVPLGVVSTTGTGATCRPAPKAFANTSKPPTTPANGAPKFDRWVQMQAGMYRGKGRESVAWNSALTYDMIFTQPVVYELDRLQMPTLLLIGEKDNTAIGKDAAPAELKARLGNYAQLGKDAARRIPQATLVEFPDLWPYPADTGSGTLPPGTAGGSANPALNHPPAALSPSASPRLARRQHRCLPPAFSLHWLRDDAWLASRRPAHAAAVPIHMEVHRVPLPTPFATRRRPAGERPLRSRGAAPRARLHR